MIAPLRLKHSFQLTSAHRRLAPAVQQEAVAEPAAPEPEPEPVPLPQAMAEKVKDLPKGSGAGRQKSKKQSKEILERLMKGHGIRIMQ